MTKSLPHQDYVPSDFYDMFRHLFSGLIFSAFALLQTGELETKKTQLFETLTLTLKGKKYGLVTILTEAQVIQTIYAFHLKRKATMTDKEKAEFLDRLVCQAVDHLLPQADPNSKYMPLKPIHDCLEVLLKPIDDLAPLSKAAQKKKRNILKA